MFELWPCPLFIGDLLFNTSVYSLGLEMNGDIHIKSWQVSIEVK